jgi:hypothetical protein
MTTRPAAVMELAQRLGAERRTPGFEVRLAQSGLLRSGPRSRWMNFTARQSICLDRAEFRWTARTGPFGAITVCDELREQAGEGSVRLLRYIPLVEVSKSPELTKGDLMRYLAELPWAPDAILSNDQLGWTELDSGKLRVTAACGNVEAAVTFALDGSGLISRVEAEDRPRQEGADMRERAWRGAFTDYRRVDGRSVPHAAEVGWIVDGARFSVWSGRLESWQVVHPA